MSSETIMTAATDAEKVLQKEEGSTAGTLEEKSGKAEEQVNGADQKKDNDDDDDDDLEDGEINDDDDILMIETVKPASETSRGLLGVGGLPKDQVITIDLSNDDSTSPTSMMGGRFSQGKRTGFGGLIPSISLIEDDHASNIENALANVLKKKGIQPTLPKMLEDRIQQQQKEQQQQQLHHQYGLLDLDGSWSSNSVNAGPPPSKSSRRRKRKRQKEEQKERSHKEKKRRYDGGMGSDCIRNEMELTMEDEDDDFEMLNVRGGSPPPVTNAMGGSLHSTMYKSRHDGGFQSLDDDSEATSYESFDMEAGDEINSSSGGDINQQQTYRRGNRPPAKDLAPSSKGRKDRRGGGKEESVPHQSQPLLPHPPTLPPPTQQQQQHHQTQSSHRSSRSESKRGGGGGGGGSGSGSGGGGGSTGGNSARSTESTADDRHRNDVRKLELCKFYLMECCAKKEKCSYMHADFPCKYYYLGMECAQKDDCKFAHGEPMNEELRNILLKHLETAPKEILGNFKRISRENAISLMSKRHEELCVKYNRQNIWGPFTSSNLVPATARRPPTNKVLISEQPSQASSQSQSQQQPQQSQQKAKAQAQQQQSSSTQPQSTSIPSLLDMVIKPPKAPADSGNSNGNSTGTTASGSSSSAARSSGGECTSSSSSEKTRKSRWADNKNSTSTVGQSDRRKSGSLDPPSRSAPTYLDLKNLSGILSLEHIEKLSQLGVVNLEQVNQLTFGQLNQIGLTIAEISEIQLNAMNVAKLGMSASSATESNTSSIVSTTSTTATLAGAKSSVKTAKNETGSTRSTEKTAAAGVKPGNPRTSEKEKETEKTVGAVKTLAGRKQGDGMANIVNYSQYLKDSNLSCDRGDNGDDEDDEHLVIDAGDEEEERNVEKLAENNAEMNEGEQTNTDQAGVASNFKIAHISDVLKNLRNPFRSTSGNSSSPQREEETKDEDEDKGSNAMMAKGVETGATATATTTSNLSRDPRQMSSRQSYVYPRSRSRTPPANSRSNTPEPTHSLSPKPFEQAALESKEIAYHRSTMYDYSEKIAAKDEQRRANDQLQKSLMAGSFFTGGESGTGGQRQSGPCEFDLNLPFQPITNYTPATEIDGSISSYLPKAYKVLKIDIDRPSYFELRQNFKSDSTLDPRLRRILGLPELEQAKNTVSLPAAQGSGSSGRRLRSPPCIASPDSSEEQTSPKYYTPPANTSTTTAHMSVKDTGSSSSSNSSSIRSSEKPSTAAPPSSHRGDPRCASGGDPRCASGGDPRRKPSSSTSNNNMGSHNSSYRNDGKTGNDNRSAGNQPPSADNAIGQQQNSGSMASSSSTSQSSVSSSATAGIVVNGGQKQNIEIRNLLQKSDWYKNLNSKFKIMVNQQLALVSTELKKFHQDPSPNKIFDISFIVSNTTLQQILTNLGIYIDDNGEVVKVESDSDNTLEARDADRNQPQAPTVQQHHHQLQHQQQQHQQSHHALHRPMMGGNNAGGVVENMNYLNLNQPPPMQSVNSSNKNNAGNQLHPKSNCNSNVYIEGATGGGVSGVGMPLEFLRAPPPCVGGGNNNGGGVAGVVNNGSSIFQRSSIQQVGLPIYGNRPSLLGMPPPRQFNPFAQVAGVGGPTGPQYMDGVPPGGMMGPFLGNANAGVGGIGLSHPSQQLQPLVQQQQQPSLRNISHRNHRHQMRRNKI